MHSLVLLGPSLIASAINMNVLHGFHSLTLAEVLFPTVTSYEEDRNYRSNGDASSHGECKERWPERADRFEGRLTGNINTLMMQGSISEALQSAVRPNAAFKRSEKPVNEASENLRDNVEFQQHGDRDFERVSAKAIPQESIDLVNAARNQPLSSHEPPKISKSVIRQWSNRK
ncbi:hypothetical protein BDZ91DRAFT_762502 [Kalaharituber pfeilii]|nr:hypothetical protein BDZ91DRAFT_762502 [Kalaharituber pfeilii]